MNQSFTDTSVLTLLLLTLTGPENHAPSVDIARLKIIPVSEL